MYSSEDFERLYIRYLKKIFREIVNGNCDYARMLPQTIGLTPLMQ